MWNTWIIWHNENKKSKYDCKVENQEIMKILLIITIFRFVIF